jgi:DNA gyrase subunit B
MNAEIVGNDDGPKFQNLIQVTIGYQADRVFSMLMGDEVPPRREFIEKTLFTQILMPNWLIRIN